MNVSIVTGSRSSTDNWTSVYTFGLGIICGVAIFAILGDPNQRNDDVLKLFLAVITAMLGAALGFAGSRLTDRISDRRKVRRKLLVFCLHTRALRRAWQQWRDAVHQWTITYVKPGDDFDAAFKANFDNSLAETVQAMRAMHRAAQASLSLEDIIETDEDTEFANKVFDTFQASLVMELYGSDGHTIPLERLNSFIHDKTVARCDRITAELDQALEHFTKRMSE